MLRILDKISSSALFTAILESVASRGETQLAGVAGSLRSVVAALVHQRTGDPILMVLEERADADAVYADVITLLGSDHALLYQQEHHSSATLRESLDAEVISLTDVLKTLIDTPNRVVVTDIESIRERVPPPAQVAQSMIEIARGSHREFDEFAKLLALGGYERSDAVQSVGEFAVRGGIIDIFPVGLEGPIRIEFFGNEVDSIREFDPLSQRSVREINRVALMSRLFHSDQQELLTATLLDHLPEQTIVMLEEPERLVGLLEDAKRPEIATALLRRKLLSYSALFSSESPDVIDVGGRSQPSFSSSLKEFCRGTSRLLEQGYTVYVLADGADAIRRLGELVEGECDRAEIDGEPYDIGDRLGYDDETLTNGFLLPSMKLALLTEHEVFNRRRARTRRRQKQFRGFTLRELRQLRPGDYVVHIDKGIGRFIGLQTISAAGSKGEAVKLEYASGDTLFVNLNYINRLQKYSSKEGAQPKLSKLGTEDWERAKARAKKRVKDIARELIRLYALRKSQPGIQFPPDTQWQRELEASFMYDDTPDQARATYEVKRDMENPVPMDRLVCGDVGFGKTEVAVRAAFKAVQGGTQVAILAPTTILAQQHYHTFRDRLSRYAVSVDLMSRFRSKAEQKETLEKLKTGSVDVLIGTHRILSRDVRFRSLGLLIIDEEQRFGVSAKEKLRQMRTAVDTLTLTATPIPRTLNFSLLGARDLSMIETPPRNRLPIITELMTWNDDVLRDALARELARSGQCFVVHWRIGDIEEIAGKIAELVPDARVGVVHGEMSAANIEKTMMAFIERRFDILVATKIVESGIDIPAVNTIVINRADKFGLAELYQLRGRVGRSNIQAFCYMIVPPATSLSRIALKRLQAIQEMTDLGSGLRLAMRDLEIRGAGNLLGAEQSGFIEDIGFELYQRIVNEAVEELRRYEFRDIFRDRIEQEDSTVELPVNEGITVEVDGDALIPKSYIADDADRYDFYLKMYTSTDRVALGNSLSEMRDRFGTLPAEAERLADAVMLRLAAMPTGGARIALRDGAMRLELPSDANHDFYERWFQPIMETLAHNRNAQLETKGRMLAIQFSGVNTIDEAVRVLEGFTSGMAHAKNLSVQADTPSH